MGFEVDFIAVGDGERGGDAIALRFGNLLANPPDQQVVVIDGGTKEAGQKLVEHIKEYYKTNKVNLVISTHPDSDHTSGLTVIFDELEVGMLMMHRPWEYAEEANALRAELSSTSAAENRFKKSLAAAYELEKIAKKKRIEIVEPFSDYSLAEHTAIVLGPSKDYYISLIPKFRAMPQSVEQASRLSRLLEMAKATGQEVISWIGEQWGVETLQDPEEEATSAENNSSAIILFQIDGKKLLLTADAGTPALERAAVKAESLGISLNDLRLIQIPHHGSRRNVGPTLLDMLIGPPQAEFSRKLVAYVSAPKQGDPKHPSRRVTNAFTRRGAEVHSTQGTHLRHHFEAPDRGWKNSTPIPFHDQVEEVGQG